MKSNDRQFEPVINGKIIAWTQYDLEGYSSVYYKDLATGISKKVLNTNEFQFNPAIDNNHIVWVQTESGNSNIYYKDLKTGKVSAVLKSKHSQLLPSIWVISLHGSNMNPMENLIFTIKIS